MNPPETSPRKIRTPTCDEIELRAYLLWEQALELRAYLLWEQAGRPEGREEYFWREAERQLSASRTGDTARFVTRTPNP